MGYNNSDSIPVTKAELDAFFGDILPSGEDTMTTQRERMIDGNMERGFSRTLALVEEMIGEDEQNLLHAEYRNSREEDSETYAARNITLEFKGSETGSYGQRNHFIVQFQIAPFEYNCALGLMEDLQVSNHWHNAVIDTDAVLKVFSEELRHKLRREGFAHSLLFCYSDEEIIEQGHWAETMGFEIMKSFISYKTTHNINMAYLQLVTDEEQEEVNRLHGDGEHYEEEYF